MAQSNLFMHGNKRIRRRKRKGLQLHSGAAERAFERVIMKRALNHRSPRNVNFGIQEEIVLEKFMDQGQKFAAYSVGKETIVTDVSKIFIRDMVNQSGDKIQDR